jgi:hypothetical protein
MTLKQKIVLVAGIVIVALAFLLPPQKYQQKKPKSKTQIAATDKETDFLVYKLYDLTEKEIAIVGGKDN